MLEVIGAAPGVNADRDWVRTWRESSEFVAVTQELDKMEPQMPALHQQNETELSSRAFASPFYFQLRMCLQRSLEQYWRDPSYIYVKLGLCTATVSTHVQMGLEQC
jgi:hypothetical protein